MTTRSTDISDGYHTFGELYDHRDLLFINLWLQTPHFLRYLEQQHYTGYDLLGIFIKDKSGYKQISYHVQNKFAELYINEAALPKPEFDGHTSSDVIDRLKTSATQHWPKFPRLRETDFS